MAKKTPPPAEDLTKPVDSIKDKDKTSLTEADKEQFFKCFLSNTPFEEEVKIFNNKVVIKFRSLNVAENSDVQEQLRLDIEAASTMNRDVYDSRTTIYRMSLALQSVDSVPVVKIAKDAFKSEDKNVTYIKELSKVFDTWPTFKLASFIKAFLTFEYKLIELERAVTDINFWKAAE